MGSFRLRQLGVGVASYQICHASKLHREDLILNDYMGGVESRFNSLLVEGNEAEALDLWHGNPELQARFRPEVPIKSTPFRDTPLHSAARGSMKVLMHEFLAHGADPRAKNANGETPLHVVCSSARFSSRTNRLRADLLRLLLDRLSPFEQNRFEDVGNGVLGAEESGMGERTSSTGAGEADPYNLALTDKNSNTPLHLAATSGLILCVELLLAHNAPLFVYNIAGQTPCEVAADAKQLIIAKLLESKMVFTTQGDPEGGNDRNKVIMSRSRNRSFHSTETLTKLRTEIIEQVAADLQVTDYCAQALLMAYSWSDDLVTEAWSQDRKGACEKAGLDPDTVQQSDYHHRTLAATSLSTVECNICFLTYTPDEMVQVPCSHHFCEECWKQYLACEIEQGLGREIRCPEHNCYKIVPNETISDLVPEDLFQKYAHLNLNNFVDIYSAVKWCPYPNCESAVSVKTEVGGGAKKERGQSSADGICLGFNVECRNGHGFCWHCMKEPHEPCDCKLWQKWSELISTNGDVDGAVAKLGQEAAANARWIVSFTKPCPNCKSPIQKNEGCNHITCKKCRYDFCWVCLDPWHLHSHKTGGYFTCNRVKEQIEARKHVEKARQGMMAAYVKDAKEREVQNRKRFDHYFIRYSNHLHSLEMELNLLQESQRKTAELAKLGQVLERKVAATRKQVCIAADCGLEEDTDAAAVAAMSHGGNFLDDVIRVLLNARRVLSASYCIGYFIPPESNDLIQGHETLQGKLEEVVEMLSQVVSRPYLRTPQEKIREMARNVDHTCEEYLSEMKQVARAAAEHSIKVFKKDTPKKKTPPPNPRPPRQRRPTPAHPGRRPPLNRPDNAVVFLQHFDF